MIKNMRISAILKPLSFTFLAFVWATGCEEVNPPIDLTERAYETGVGAPVSPDDKVVLIEDFTGAACPNCPDAHIAIGNAYAAYPGQVVAIAEYNYFADPLHADEDLRTEEALLLNDYLGPAIGWPASFIDRKDFDNDDYMPEIPANVVPYCGDQVVLTPPCNITITNTYDATSRKLDVVVRVDYTSAVTLQNKLSVVLIENGIIAAQVDDNVGGEVEDYEHNHVMRDMLSYYLGDALPEENVPGRWYTFVYSTTLPTEWNADNMAVVAFVHNFETDNKEVLQAAEAEW